MQPVFERGTGYLIIEWYEKKKDSSASPTRHYFSAKPSVLQLHPKDPSRIVRATFTEKMPAWMEKYCKAHDFQCKQVTRYGEVGFWIANWNVYPNGSRPFSSPIIDGAVEQFVKRLPDFLEEQRERLLANRETIKQNLLNHPKAFESFGLYYRSEELSGNGGCMVIGDVIPESKGESEEDYQKRILLDGRLEQLINEMITPLPVIVDPDEETDFEEAADEAADESFEYSVEESVVESFDESFAETFAEVIEEVIEDVVENMDFIEIFDEVIEEDESGIDGDSVPVDVVSDDDTSLELVEEEILTEFQVTTEEMVEDNHLQDQLPDEQQETSIEVVIELEQPAESEEYVDENKGEEDNVSLPSSDPILQVVEASGKKDIAGQLALF